jgi:hypothetical protein
VLYGNKEVMINNLPEPGELNGMLTPQTLFSFYEGDSYIRPDGAGDYCRPPVAVRRARQTVTATVNFTVSSVGINKKEGTVTKGSFTPDLSQLYLHLTRRKETSMPSPCHLEFKS